MHQKHLSQRVSLTFSANWPKVWVATRPDLADSESFPVILRGSVFSMSKELAKPIVETFWDNVNISMADVDCYIILDQIDINPILEGPIGTKSLNATENGRMLDDDQVHP